MQPPEFDDIDDLDDLDAGVVDGDVIDPDDEFDRALTQWNQRGQVATRGMSEACWLRLRRLSFGASDAGAALGVDPWRTACELVEQKLGWLEDDDDTRWRQRNKREMGHAMEPVTARRFVEGTGLTVRNHSIMLRHPDHPFMSANIDREIVGLTMQQRAWLSELFGYPISGPGVLELKNVEFAREWGEPDHVASTGGLSTSGIMPERYLAQVQQQMAVRGVQWGFLAATIAGWETRYYPISRDDELIDWIIDVERQLQAHINTETLPMLDTSSPRAGAILKRRYPGTDGRIIDASALDHYARVERESRERIKTLTVTADECRAVILEHMQEAAVARFSDGTALRRKRITPKGRTPYLDVRYTARLSAAEQAAWDELTTTETDDHGSEETDADEG